MHKTYILDTNKFIYKPTNSKILPDGSFTWKAPSNIALVKYWGKHGMQLPKNTSISFTLDACYTLSTLEFHKKKGDKANFEIYFDGKKKDDFKSKISTFFERIKKYVPFISHYDLIIKSKNSFPHSSGIASSASSMAALALCIMSIEKALNPDMLEEFFYQKASFLARLGSGSAARSIKGSLVVWGEHPDVPGSSDLFGIEFPYKVHETFKDFQDTILLVDKGEKQVSSTVGHDLMHDHPFAEQRFSQASENIQKLSEILRNGDLKAFIELVESEALTLHAMMMTSNPYFILMKPNTLSIINKIWGFRKETAANICFTLDAGANVHVLYPEREKELVTDFITSQLLQFCENKHAIYDSVGSGAKQM